MACSDRQDLPTPPAGRLTDIVRAFITKRGVGPDSVWLHYAYTVNGTRKAGHEFWPTAQLWQELVRRVDMMSAQTMNEIVRSPGVNHSLVDSVLGRFVTGPVDKTHRVVAILAVTLTLPAFIPNPSGETVRTESQARPVAAS